LAPLINPRPTSAFPAIKSYDRGAGGIDLRHARRIRWQFEPPRVYVSYDYQDASALILMLVPHLPAAGLIGEKGREVKESDARNLGQPPAPILRAARGRGGPRFVPLFVSSLYWLACSS
jgi:hypothetical protein